MSWQDRASCRPGTPAAELPWTEAVVRRSEQTVMRAVCATCPVRPECESERIARPSSEQQGMRAGVSVNQAVRHDAVCAVCGARFESAAVNAKVCSDACRTIRDRERKRAEATK